MSNRLEQLEFKLEMVKNSGTSFAFLVISKEKCLTIFGHPLDISTTVYGFGGLYSRKMEEEVGSIRGVITRFS